MATVNLSLPKITMEELEDDAKLQKILSYLYQLNEQLRYELTHIDDDNISKDGISEVSLTDSVSRTLKNDQGEVLELYMNARRMILELTGKVDESAGSLEVISERMAKVEVNSERIETEVSYIQEAQDETNADVKTLTEKVTTVEQTADGLERTITEVKSEVNSVDGSVTQLEERVLQVEESAEGLKVEVSEKVTQKEVDESIENIDEFHNTAVDIEDDGITMNTTGSIRALVNDIEQLTIDQDGVAAKQVVADEVHAGNIVEMHMSSTAEWKGGIQATIDALPKYLTQDTELTIPAGTYREDVFIRGFYGSRLRLTFSKGTTLIGSINVFNSSHIVVRAASLGDGYIYPPTAINPVVFYAVTRAQVSNMYISGYRLRTSASNGSDIALYFNSCHALVENCCLEYANKGLSTNYSIVYAEGNRGGQSGSDPTTNANIKNGILASSGSHLHLVGSYPMGGDADYDTYRGALNTYSLGSATAGGMEYTEPEYITQTFSISKHCTYLYGVSRTRDDQSNLFSQGRYGTYEVASHTNYWRIGAMWFADAAAALAGKTIQSAQLKIRRGSGGWSNAVGVYLGKVALAESAFTSTLTPSFTAASTYPIGSLKRETEATYDVTDLISAIQAGQAIGVFEPRDDYSGNYSPAYTTFYGKGSNYEPTLTVTYK